MSRFRLSFLFGLCFAVCLTGCGLLEEVFVPKEAFTWINSESYVGVIFPAQTAREQNMLFWLYGNQEVEGYWTPTIDDVANLEKRLPDYLRATDDPRFQYHTPIWEQLHLYQRQYIGLIENGRDVIYANYFCAELGQWDLTSFVMVDDGGDCFFQIQYDVEHQSFYNLMVNGFA